MRIAVSVTFRTCARVAWSSCAGSAGRTRSNTGTTSIRDSPAGSRWMKRIDRDLDKILISSIDCVAAIGVTAEERTIRQRLSIDVEVFVDAARAARADSLKDTIDYSRVATLVMDVCRGRDFHLIETLAELLAARIL